jgi:hypothetical protein
MLNMFQQHRTTTTTTNDRNDDHGDDDGGLPPLDNQKIVPSSTISSSSSSLGLLDVTAAAMTTSTSCSSSYSTFPMKLHAMLSDSEGRKFDDVVAWLPGGRSFKVLDPVRFADEIMPHYFNQTKYKSFQRQ